MKKIMLTLFVSVFLFLNTYGQTAQNISFTDLDNVSHDIYSYLDSGYTVILDFSYQYCGPCNDWSINVGHDLWESYGPDGENQLRMFFFDVDLELIASDENVANYTQEWGIEYPVINLDGHNSIPEYPEDSYPTIYIICPDRSFSEIGGYGYPYSEIESHLFFEQCQGMDLNSNATLFEASEPTEITLCDQTPIQYVPTLILIESETILNNSLPTTTPFSIEVFINDQLTVTQSINPGDGSSFYHEFTLDPIEVSLNDTLTIVSNYPGDNFAGDDTLSVIIPETIVTNSSTDTTLMLLAEDNTLYFSVFDAQGQELLSSMQGSQSFDLPIDSCYSISFVNAHLYGATLKDANNHEILSFEAGQFIGYETPKLYFHVNNSSVGIQEVNESQILIHRYYIDLLGKSYTNTEFKALPSGIYFEISHYENGGIHTTKRYHK